MQGLAKINFKGENESDNVKLLNAEITTTKPYIIN